MKKIIFIGLILANVTVAQTDFNSGFGEYTFGSSFNSILQKLIRKHFVQLRVEYNEAWLSVLSHSYVTLDCDINDSTGKQWLRLEFFNDSLFVIGLQGTDAFTDSLNREFKFVFQIEQPLFGSPHTKYPKDSNEYYLVDQVRINYETMGQRYELRLKNIDDEYIESKNKAKKLQENGASTWSRVKG